MTVSWVSCLALGLELFIQGGLFLLSCPSRVICSRQAKRKVAKIEYQKRKGRGLGWDGSPPFLSPVLPSFLPLRFSFRARLRAHRPSTRLLGYFEYMVLRRFCDHPKTVESGRTYKFFRAEKYRRDARKGYQLHHSNVLCWLWKNEVEWSFSCCCKILDSDRETIARLRNCIVTLTDNGVMLFNTSLQYAYDASMKHSVGNVMNIHYFIV